MTVSSLSSVGKNGFWQFWKGDGECAEIVGGKRDIGQVLKMQKRSVSTGTHVSCAAETVMYLAFFLQMQNQLDETKSNVSKEIRVRERAEQYAKDLESEMERLKRKHIGRSEASANAELTEEISRYPVRSFVETGWSKAGYKHRFIYSVEGAGIAQLVVLGLAVHSVAGSILLWGHFPVEGIFPLELTWVQTPFPQKLFRMRV